MKLSDKIENFLSELDNCRNLLARVQETNKVAKLLKGLFNFVSKAGGCLLDAVDNCERFIQS
ncbi:MAG: hypothetical protein F6K40_06110 [Okeania sp. SIO3I5]|uniref:hypothetical protein n=1 Tax=Okeania sp. SIO3I5 TaxID=2607805 RepID=UPI0013BA65FD|nr:hypothetical protein [Okeania sp. SIO3I5]NEQ35882.1 hypothetical protein [Okeania sp. SIO3I5]